MKTLYSKPLLPNSVFVASRWEEPINATWVALLKSEKKYYNQQKKVIFKLQILKI